MFDRLAVLFVLAAFAVSSVAAFNADLEKFLRHYEPLYLNTHEIHRRHSLTHRYTSTPGSFDIHFTALNRDFRMSLKQDDSSLLPEFEVRVHGNNKYKTVHFDRRNVTSGFLIGQEFDSDVSMVITDKGMVGSIYDRRARDTYFIESSARYYPNATDFHHIIYRLSDLDMNNSEVAHAFEGNAFDRMLALQRTMGNGADPTIPPPSSSSSSSSSSSNPHNHRHRRAFDKTTQNTCELALVADYLFYSTTGQSSVSTATSIIISWVNSMTRIYKYSDFTSVGLGIQFALKQITVYTDTNNIYYTSSTDVNIFLDLASQGDPLLNNWDSVCLAHVLTHKTFDNGILGLAWVGASNAGICAKSASYSGGTKSLNTGVSTTQNFGADVPAIVSIITMSHECGHNFGSTHDLPGSSSDGEQCAPGDSNGGNYIMYATSSTGLLPNNNQFSQCSLDLMGALILTRGSACFTNRGNSPICGNGIFEGTPEQCDCGVNPQSPTALADCWAKDPCCLPNCTIIAGGQCSPKAGSCCHPNCTLSGYPKQANGTYPRGDDTTVANYVCGSSTSCAYPQYCIADPLFAGACPPIDWFNDPSHPSINTTILNATAYTCDSSDPPCYQFHYPTGTPCSGALCSVTGCDLSLCQIFKSTNKSGIVPPETYPRTAAVPCLATDASQLYSDLECVVACEFEAGVCVATSAYASTADGIAQKVNLTYRAAGTYCSSYRGRCDGQGKCTAVGVDNALDAFNSLGIAAWIVDNWYIVLAAGLGAILLGVVLHFTYRRKKVDLQAALRKLGRTLRRPNRKRNATLMAAARPSKEPNRAMKRISRSGGFRRLLQFFPTAEPQVVWSVMKVSKNEEDAVSRLLDKGVPLAALDKFEDTSASADN